MKGFKNVLAYVYKKGLVKTDIAIENGKIVAIGEGLDITEPFSVAKNHVVVPGFIDRHVHGADGADAMDGTVTDLSTIANGLAKEGTTSFLATTMTQSKENITKALNAVKEYRAESPVKGARVLGVHLEGPFISTKFIGAQPLEYVDAPSVETFDKYHKASGNSIKVVSFAPEEEGGSALITHLNSLGVCPSAGHTNASANVIEQSIKTGLKSITHTFNAQKPVHHRDLGVAGSALLFDELYTEIICDFIHLSPLTVKLVYKNKPKDKIILITDAMRAKGLPDCISELGGQKVIVKNGEARLEDGTLAGSTLKMNNAIKNLVQGLSIPLCDAIDFATVNPAKSIGVDGDYGTIEVGKYADFAVLDNDFNVALTVKEGEIIYKG